MCLLVPPPASSSYFMQAATSVTVFITSAHWKSQLLDHIRFLKVGEGAVSVSLSPGCICVLATPPYSLGDLHSSFIAGCFLGSVGLPWGDGSGEGGRRGPWKILQGWGPCPKVWPPGPTAASGNHLCRNSSPQRQVTGGCLWHSLGTVCLCACVLALWKERDNVIGWVFI